MQHFLPASKLKWLHIASCVTQFLLAGNKYSHKSVLCLGFSGPENIYAGNRLVVQVSSWTGNWASKVCKIRWKSYQNFEYFDKILVKTVKFTYNLVIYGPRCFMLFKNLDFVWLKEFHQVLESTSEPRNGSVRKNLREPDPEPAKSHSQF